MSSKPGVESRLLGLALAGLILLTGCSLDRSTYESTVNLPTTVTVEDPYTHHVYWGMEIPVGRALTIDLDRAGEFELFRVSGKPATSLNWKLKGAGKDEGGSLGLPGTPVVLVVSYRPSPEYPAGYTGPRPAESTPSASPAPAPVPLAPAAPQPQAAPSFEPSPPPQPAPAPLETPAPEPQAQQPAPSIQAPAEPQQPAVQELDQALEEQK